MPRKRKDVAAEKLLPMHIRWLIRRDMPEVLEIERRCFDMPCAEEDLLRWLVQSNCIGMVCEMGNATPYPPIGGFMIYELHKTRIEVVDFAVHPNWQRRGIGRLMVGKLLEKLSGHRRTKLSVNVPERRLDAQLFFRAMGFEAVRVERHYFGDEDAYRMVLTIPVAKLVESQS